MTLPHGSAFPSRRETPDRSWAGGAFAPGAESRATLGRFVTWVFIGLCAVARMATPVAAQSGRPSEGKASVGKAARQAGDKRSRAAAQPERRRSAPSRKAQRERWNKLPADRRKEMQRIYSRLNELPPDKRTRLLERLRNLDADARREKIRRAKKQLESDDNPIERQSRRTRRRMFERLPRQVRERLRTLPPRERQKHVQQHFAKRRAALIGKLPPRMANEVRKLPPEKQAQRLRQYRTN